MKLLYIHNIALNEGMSTIVQVVSMCKAFAQNGIDVILATPKSNLSLAEVEKFLFKNFNVNKDFKLVFFPNVTPFKKLSKFLNFLGIKKNLFFNRPDICFVRDPLFFYTCVKHGFKTLFEVHNSKFHTRLKILNFIFTYLVLKTSKKENCLKFITISKNLSQYWSQKGVIKEKILAIHDGFDSTLFQNQPSIKSAKKELGLCINKKLIVYSGSLFENRNIEYLILLAEKFSFVKFVIIGGPNDKKKKFESLAKRRKVSNIIFLGRKKHKEIPKYLFAADILLALWSSKVPTINYCSPLKLFEYMAAGRVILAHSFPPIQEVLTDGLNAILVKPDSIDDLKKKFKLALNLDNHIFISNNSRKLAFRKYSWEVRTKTIINSLKKSMT